MSTASATSGAVSSAEVEATIRRRARPVLSADERKQLAAQKQLEACHLAAARCREAAAEQLRRAEEWDERAAALGGGSGDAA